MHTDTEPLPPATHLGRTALLVSDLTGMVEFYRDVVGLTVRSHTSTTAVLGVEGTPLLILEADPEAPSRPPAGAGLFHTAFRVPSRGALGDALARIQTHWELSGASDHGVSEALYLTDPEGNGVELYRDYPREDWPRTGDGRVRMGTYHLDLEPLEAAAAGQPGVPAETDIGHVHLEVTSLETFSDFYVDTVGFEPQTELQAARFVGAGGYHHHIGANTWNNRTEPIRGTGLSWFEVVLPDTETLVKLRERLTAGQYPLTETETGFAVTGPDEIQMRLRSTEE
ncbi:VOC family protein [Halosegnis longus]|uniref:VOC family protein n=1 Tax=Halosegnis longus TaxID=2216012 RepID=UPI00096AA7B9|nr:MULTISPECIES: VOC family protein [Halobacteriales]